MGRRVNKTVFRLCMLTAAVHAFNKLIFKNAVRKEILDKNGGKYFKTEYGKMFYKVKGEGKPLLLVHDVSCSSSGFEWNNVVRELSKNHKLYVVDLIGCGRSDKPNIAYTSYFYVQLMSNFIKDIIKEKTDIAATGKSSSFVSMLCKMEDSLVDKFIAVSPELIDNFNYSKMDLFDSIKKKVLITPILGTACYNLAVSKNIIEEKFEEDYFFETSKVRNVFINAYYESAHLGGPNSRYLYTSIFSNYLFCNPLSALGKFNKSNYLMIFGNENKNCSKIYKQYKNINNDINKVIVDNSKILPQLEQPVNFVNAIIQFLG